MGVPKIYEMIVGLTSHRLPPNPPDNFSLTFLCFLATLGASYILVLLVSGQPVGGDAVAAASWGIIFQLTRFALIQPCNKTSNQKRSNLETVCEKATRHFLAISKPLFALRVCRMNFTGCFAAGRRPKLHLYLWKVNLYLGLWGKKEVTSLILHDLYRSACIVMVVKCGRLRWAGYVASVNITKWETVWFVRVSWFC
jgi:hypothetical protein